MKKALFALVVVLFPAERGIAADFYWDADATTTGNDATTGASLGGTGTWNNLLNLNWWDGVSGTNSQWNDAGGNTAVFWGTAGTASLSSPRTASGLKFKTTGYVIQTSTLTLTSTPTIAIDPGVSATITSAIAGTTGYHIAGGGTVRFAQPSNLNSITGAVSVTGGSTLELSIGGQIGGTGVGSGDVTLNGGTLRNTDTASSYTFLTANRQIIIGANGGTISTPNTIGIYSGTLSGTGTLTKTGAGEFRVQGAGMASNTFAKLVVDQGLYRVGNVAGNNHETALGAAPVSPLADAITLTNGASLGASFGLTLNANRGITLGTGGGGFNTSAGTITVPSAITGAGDLLKNTTGTLTLSGTNNYSGNTLISAGILIAGSASALGNTAGHTQVSSGAELRTDLSTLTIAEAISIAGSGSGGTTGAINVQNSSTTTFSGPITLSGAATVTVSGTSTVNYTNAAAFTGTNQNLTLAGGGSSTGNGGTISGEISLGTGSLTKNQGGTWRLNNATGNTYSGGTIINSGTLLANNATGSATGSGGITINGGTLGGTGAVAGAVTVKSGGTLAPGASIESLDTGALTFEGGSNLNVEINTSVSLTAGADLLNSSGGLSIAPAANLNVVDVAGTSVVLPNGVKYTLIKYDATAGWDGGVFAGKADGDSFAVGANVFVINYSDTTGGVNFVDYSAGAPGALFVTLTAVPEASALLFGGLACCLAGVVAYKRRRA